MHVLLGILEDFRGTSALRNKGGIVSGENDVMYCYLARSGESLHRDNVIEILGAGFFHGVKFSKGLLLDV